VIRAEDARAVYDPFLGSGTTALVALQLGLRTGGAEVNPFLRFVTRVKTTVASRLAQEPSEDLRARLRTIVDRAEKVRPDPKQLGSLFKDADYFEQIALADIVRVKTAIDSHAGLAVEKDFALLALGRVLVDASNMIRRADLRRRRENETNGQAKTILPRFTSALEMMVDDLEFANFDSSGIAHMGLDACQPPGIGERMFDLCVTSPPYLNGTNYVRNTKIEMWVLGMISTSQDMRRIRDQAVTAGINNVRLRGRSMDFADPQISSVLKALEEAAYDRRIPVLVADYLRDMAAVFRATSLRLRPGSPLYLDIGDSKFAGVYVPTHDLLTSVARDAGLTLVDSEKIRDRRSKDGSKLQQRLLVFRTPTPRRERARANTPRRRLQRLVEDRPFGRKPFAARNWGHPWHSMCSYQAKLKPSIAHFLVREFSSPGEVVLDPFSGAGTIPLEACLQGRVGWGNDISPLAIQLTRAKTSNSDRTTIESRLGELLAFVEENDEVRVDEDLEGWGMNGPLDSYFDPATMREILSARTWLLAANQDAVTAMLWAASAHILHGNRPYALSRRSHPITPFAPSGAFEHRRIRPRLEGKVERLLDQGPGDAWSDGLASALDARSLSSAGDRADVIVTSPPFYDSTRFHSNNWMRIWFCGWEPDDFIKERERFLEQQQRRDFNVYAEVTRSFHQVLRPGGLAVWHLGKSKRFDMARALEDVGDPWFASEGVFEEDVSSCQSHGVSDQGGTHTHQFLLMRAR
jgi:DNA modification methylase